MFDVICAIIIFVLTSVSVFFIGGQVGAACLTFLPRPNQFKPKTIGYVTSLLIALSAILFYSGYDFHQITELFHPTMVNLDQTYILGGLAIMVSFLCVSILGFITKIPLSPALAMWFGTIPLALFFSDATAIHKGYLSLWILGLLGTPLLTAGLSYTALFFLKQTVIIYPYHRQILQRRFIWWLVLGGWLTLAAFLSSRPAGLYFHPLLVVIIASTIMLAAFIPLKNNIRRLSLSYADDPEGLESFFSKFIYVFAVAVVLLFGAREIYVVANPLLSSIHYAVVKHFAFPQTMHFWIIIPLALCLAIGIYARLQKCLPSFTEITAPYPLSRAFVHAYVCTVALAFLYLLNIPLLVIPAVIGSLAGIGLFDKKISWNQVTRALISWLLSAFIMAVLSGLLFYVLTILFT